MVAATIRKMQAPNQLAAVFDVSGSPELNFPYTFTPPIKPHHRTDGVNQFRSRFKIRGDHLRGFGDARLPVSLRHCAHGSQYAGRRE